jgi:hypothetical protein
MRNALLTILTGSTALVASLAYAQAPAPAQATLADCDRLQAVLEQQRPANAGVTLDQVRTYRVDNNAQACRDALVKIDPTGGAGTNIVVQQPAPSVRVDQGAPNVTVQQQQPQVTVHQPQPEIMVRQPAPTVTIDIPQPEIVVRMPRPQVDVAMAQPQVQVTQPPPQVQVTQPQQPQVQVKPAEARVTQQGDTTAKVQIEENKTPPAVQYERAEPKVVITQPQGQPEVRFEQIDQAQPARQQQNAEQTQNAPQPNPQGRSSAGDSNRQQEAATTGVGNRQSLQVARLKMMYIFNPRGTRLGDVERVVQDQEGKRHLVVGVGGFLGIGERHVAIPIERVVMRGGTLMVEGLPDEQIKSMPAFNSRNYRELDNNATLEIGAGTG